MSEEEFTDISACKEMYKKPLERKYHSPDQIILTIPKPIKSGDVIYEKVHYEVKGQTFGIRYGTNPTQDCDVYAPINSPTIIGDPNLFLKMGKGGPSLTNLQDMDRSLQILKYFDDPAVAVMKHLNPSGFATGQKDLSKLYIAARDCDRRAAFGSVVGFNVPVDKATAEALTSTFVEAVLAPEYEQGVIDILEKKESLRVARYNPSLFKAMPKFIDDHADPVIKVLGDRSVALEMPYLTQIKSTKDLIVNGGIRDKSGLLHKVMTTPTEEQLKDMLTAWYVCGAVRSNGIVFVKNGITQAVGTGQQERIGAVEQAIYKAGEKEFMQAAEDAKMTMPEFLENYIIEKDQCKDTSEADLMKVLTCKRLKDSVMASDAFFPFRDCIDTIAKYGVKGVVYPAGSINDIQIIDAANEHKMPLAVTLERCFAHH
jgi:phosphoribosylaminoimidazolecarboxamide formyltransferase/IMP cyclohydrolase